MSAVASLDRWISPEAYIEGEQLSDIRHEYACGQVFAMAGATAVHNHIAGNFYADLNFHLSGKTCEAFMTDMKIRMEGGVDTFFYYPDLVVTCDPDDNDDYFRRFPKVIVEVLSPSTERIDKSEKLRAYQTIPTLEVYILLSQTAVEATVYRRSAQWQREVVSAEAGWLAIPELEFKIEFSRLYQRTGLAVE
jgi:Uma2 family endonuclease